MINPDRGKQTEYLCASLLLGKGLMPCWPSGEGQPYDFICDTSRGPKRVQVKGTYKTGRKFTADFRFARRKSYSKVEIDIFVYYVAEYDAWYVIPAEKLNKRGFTLTPGDNGCKHKTYLEAWHLLDPALKE